MQVRVGARDDSRGAVCVFCRDALQVERSAACEACGSCFHRACLGDPPACPTLGCPGRLTGLYPPLARREGRDRRSRKVTLALLGVLVASASVTALVVSAVEGARQRAAAEQQRLARLAREQREQVLLQEAQEAERQRQALLARMRAHERELAEKLRAADAAEWRRREELLRAREAELRRAAEQERRAQEPPPAASAPAVIPPGAHRLSAKVERTTAQLESEARQVMRSVLDGLNRQDARTLEASAGPAAREALAALSGWSAARVGSVHVVSATPVVDLSDGPVRVDVEVLRDEGDPVLQFGLVNRGGGWLLERVSAQAGDEPPPGAAQTDTPR